MKIVYTNHALVSLQLALDFLNLQGIPADRISSIFDRIFDRINTLEHNPFIGQRELLMPESEIEYRRIVEMYFKIIYYVADNTILSSIYLTPARTQKI